MWPKRKAKECKLALLFPCVCVCVKTWPNLESNNWQAAIHKVWRLCFVKCALQTTRKIVLCKKPSNSKRKIRSGLFKGSQVTKPMFLDQRNHHWNLMQESVLPFLKVELEPELGCFKTPLLKRFRFFRYTNYNSIKNK